MTQKKPVPGKPRDSANTVSLDLAQETLGDLVDRAATLSERIHITLHGERVAALVPVADAELLERLEDEADQGAAKQARDDIAAHGTVSLMRLKKSLVR